MLAVGTEPATAKMGTLGSETDAWVEFRRFRQHAPGFLAAIRLLKQRPIRTVRSARRTAPIRAARRVDMQTIRAAAQTGTIGPLVAGFEPAQYQTTQAEPGYDLPWYEEHFDGPANRCITALLLAVRRRAVGLLERLEDLVRQDADPETRTGLAERWPIRRRFLQDMILELKPVLRAEPFRSVTVAEISAAGLTAIAAHPVYSRAYRSGWSAIRRGLHASHASEAIWLCPSWELYERWCFGQVVSATEDADGCGGSHALGCLKRSLAGTATIRSVATGGGPTHVFIQSVGQIPINLQGAKTGHCVYCRICWGAPLHHPGRQVLTIASRSSQRHVLCPHLQRQPSLARAEAIGIATDGSSWWGAPWLEEEAFHDREGVGVLTVSPGLSDSKLSRVLQRLVDSVPLPIPE
jgi:hypothetical protein